MNTTGYEPNEMIEFTSETTGTTEQYKIKSMNDYFPKTTGKQKEDTEQKWKRIFGGTAVDN